MKRTRLKIVSVLAMLCYCIGAWSQNATQQLVVWMKSGEKVRFSLLEEPRTSFEGNLLVITTNSSSVRYQLANVRRYTYEGSFTRVNSMDAHDLMFVQTSDGVELRNVTRGTVVRLYNTAGVLLDSKTSVGSTVSFSLSALPSGVYIVNINDQNFKISKP